MLEASKLAVYFKLSSPPSEDLKELSSIGSLETIEWKSVSWLIAFGFLFNNKAMLNFYIAQGSYTLLSQNKFGNLSFIQKF